MTVIIPTYNRRSHLQLTLESLRAQDYANFEVLVCDDCSTDETQQYLSDLQQEWPQLKVFRNEKNLNFNGTLQRLFSMAIGDFVGMQHDHDVYKPNFLSRMVEVLLANPRAGFVCAGYDEFNEQDQIVPRSFDLETRIFEGGNLAGIKLLKVLASERHTPIAAMGTLFRRDALVRAGGYSSDWYLASDEDLYCRMAQVADVVFCPEPLFIMRSRPAERQKILGSWKNIYTLFLFRLSAATQLGKHDSWARFRAVCRQIIFKWRLLTRESLSLWLRGEKSQLREGLKPDLLPQLPTTQKPMLAIERLFLHLLIRPLMATTAIGLLLNHFRKANRR
ncbi:MAG: glycosyl transferase, group 2 family protein [Acidobacteriales bacterium]|nr:glycosyl transferase, group 2 family protein [Terriglobales bacterium]